MIARLKRIHHEFGIKISARIIVLLIGLVGMPIFGLIVLASPWSALIVITGLALGWLLRRTIADSFEAIAWVLPTALFIYGIVLFIGERLGLSQQGQFLIITAVTVVVFDLQFWCFSDPSIVANPDPD